MNASRSEQIVVVGLGYVGLPLAVALARSFSVVGLDIDERRVEELKLGIDRTREVESEKLAASPLRLTSRSADAAGADIYIVTVPTPVDGDNRPDLTPVISATRSVATLLDPERKPVIVYESTVYPGVTEDICGPLIEEVSGLRRGLDFFLGYSPERINPGDRQHRFETIVKVVSGQDEATCETIARSMARWSRPGSTARPRSRWPKPPR
jgi:UDP-N-acetyl-D-galactosamine dehydrogenase